MDIRARKGVLRNRSQEMDRGVFVGIPVDPFLKEARWSVTSESGAGA